MTRRILYVIRPVAGGMRQHLALLVKHLDRSEFEPLAIVPDDPLAERLRSLEVDVRVLRAVGSANPLSVCATALAVIRMVKERKVSLVHSHGYRAAIGAGVGALASGVPHVATIHTEIGGKKSAGFVGRATQIAVAGLSRRVIAVSKGIADSFAVRKVKSDKVKLVSNGVEIPYGQRRGRTGGAVVGTAARLSPEKGIDLFIEAARLIGDVDEDVRFVIMGDGPLRGELEAKAKEIGVDEKLEFMGFVDGIEEKLLSMDVLVLPSRSEGQPMVLLEAMAAGCPVVATDVGGVAEVLDGGCGAIVPPDDPAAIAAAVLKLLSFPDEARRMAEAGRKRAKEAFSVERMVRETMDIYREVLEEAFA